MLKNSSKKPLLQRFKISYMAMFLALVLLAISALPNLYPAKSWLHLSTTQSQPHSQQLLANTPSQKSVIDFLNQHGFLVEQSIQVAQNSLSLNVLLQEPTKSAAAQQALKSEFTQLNAKIVTHQTSPDWLQSLGANPKLCNQSGLV